MVLCAQRVSLSVCERGMMVGLLAANTKITRTTASNNNDTFVCILSRIVHAATKG